MKTYKQFIYETKQLEESKITLAKQALKSFTKLSRKTPVLKKVSKFFAKKPPRNIDPYFANKAFERGTMVPGYHGQSLKNITQYKKTGVPPTVSGLKTDPLVQYKNNPATLAWVKRTGYTGGETNKRMARPGIDAYFAAGTKDGKRQASIYARRGATYENEKLKNVLNPFKDKGAVMDVAVNTRSVRKGWKDLKNPGTESERIAKAQDIIPIVPGPSSKVGKYRLVQQLRKDRGISKNT
tara:strand:+ start:612 stop:1328 length:717 start_codon:yes stop_codon:yes gene_type:complete